MYPVVYWAGVATLVVWTAYSAYSAIVGLSPGPCPENLLPCRGDPGL
jgi:hypothetical protein